MDADRIEMGIEIAQGALEDLKEGKENAAEAALQTAVEVLAGELP